jgi:hypothetical protein
MKYIVSIEDDGSSANGIKSMITSVNHYKGSSVRVTVTELPEIQQPKTVKTGLIDIDPSIKLKIDGIANLVCDGDIVDLVKYPELKQFCKNESIQTSIDWDSIPVGSLVEVSHINNDSKSTYYGIYDSIDETYCILHDGKILKSNIKSVRIIEGVKA